MKAFFEQLVTGVGSSISIIQLEMTHFDGPYHFHPELELTWIRESSGRRYVGDNVSDYGPGDLVLVGANVPHCWLSGKEAATSKARAIVVQFLPSFAGEPFLDLPEVNKIQHLIKKASSGLIIKGNTKAKIISQIEKCAAADGFSRLLHFLEILDLIANSKETEPIAPYSAGMTASPSETKRFQRVYSHLIGNYQKDISLQEVANIANLTPTAFCRYLKKATRKTLVEIVTEFRINHACQLLRNSKKSVNEICFECGFGNISYFNKTFKTTTKFTPLQYRDLLPDI